MLLPDWDRLSWESSSWEKQQEEVTEHLCRGGLHQDSFHRGFTLDDKDVLLQWSNLQPAHWAPEQSTDTVPPADCPGYYQVTILGKETPAVAGSSLPYSKHCNYSATMLVLGSFYLKPKVKYDDPVWEQQSWIQYCFPMIRAVLEPSSSVLCTGINKQIAVDAAFFPIVSTADPRAVGLPQDPHGNTMLSSLSSGFLCPLGDPASASDTILPEPGRRPRGQSWQ